MRGDAIPRDAPLHAPAPPVPVPLFPLLVTSHLPGKGKYLINVTKLTPFCSCQPRHAPGDPQPPVWAGWQQVTSHRCPCRGDRLGAGLPCYCSRLFSSGEAAGPAGCHRPGTAWPILNRLHKESAALARIFSELYLSKCSTGKEGGRESSSRLALLPAAHLHQRRGCCMQHPPAGAPGEQGGVRKPPQGQPPWKSRRGGGQSIKASILPLKGSKYLPRGQAMTLAFTPSTGGSTMHRGLWKDPLGTRDKIPARPCCKYRQGSETPKKRGLENSPAPMVVPAPSHPLCPQPSC